MRTPFATHSVSASKRSIDGHPANGAKRVPGARIALPNIAQPPPFPDLPQNYPDHFLYMPCSLPRWTEQVLVGLALSEQVVAVALRNALPEFLAAAAKTSILVNSSATGLTCLPPKEPAWRHEQPALSFGYSQVGSEWFLKS
jgi:hypothetical protein